MKRRAARIVLIAVMTLGIGPLAAQDAVPTDQPPAASLPPAPTVIATNEVNVTLERMGVGNQARQGDWAGIRVGIIDTADKPRDLIVQLEGHDADGDHPVYQEKITANPGVNQSVWLYGRLPFSFGMGASRDLVVSVRLAEETGGAGEPGAPGARAGRLVGQTIINPKAGSVVSSRMGMIGIFGQRVLGLGPYASRANTSDFFHELGNEVTERVTGLSPEDMPDRWMGLAPYEAIVWADGDPSKLRGDRAQALRDWVTRGGHLIIILPPVGQTFTNPGSNELYDIMPAVLVTSREKVEFEPYRPLLTTSDVKIFPKTATVQSFRPRPDTLPSEAIRVLNGPDNECVVARRLVGAGAVTMVGLDLNQTALSQFDLIDVDVFWHRVLGRRGQLVDATKNSATGGARGNFFPGTNQAFVLDSEIPTQIAKSGKSAAGVLAGLIVFALYWGIAGPIGFAVLKRRGLSHHSWVFFVLSAGVFTALAWGGATALRPKRVEATHFTILDHVFGQSVQRARMWASVLIPKYGTATLGVQNDRNPGGLGADKGSLNAIASWDTPEPGSGADFGGFPDARGYPVDTRMPDHITVPTRSTVKQVQADWAGGPRWEMPIPSSVDGSPGGSKIVLRPETWAELQTPLVTGSLVHKMPGPLHDVVVIVVVRQMPLIGPRPRPKTNTVAPPLFEAYAFATTADWPPGVPLILDDVTKILEARAERNKLRAATYFESLVPKGTANFNAMTDPTQARRPTDIMTALAFFPMLPQPDRESTAVTHYIPQRTSTHGWDLGMWFTQPSIMIVGRLGGDGEPYESPVPLTVDGEAAPTLGRTIVRWVYPLPDDPPAFPPPDAAGAKPEGGDPAPTEPKPG